MSLFEPLFSNVPEFWQALVCLLVVGAMGAIFSFIYIKFKNLEGYFRDTPITFIVLPLVVAALIMGVTAIGYSIGTSSSEIVTRYGRYLVALVGVVCVLKFRSQQRTPELLTYYLFLILAGVLCGIGYLLYATFVFALVVIVFIIIHLLKYPRIPRTRLSLKVTIPEDLNYEHVFDDVFARFTKAAELVRVKTSDLGTLFILRYEIILKKDANQKEFLDEIRKRNSNLDIVLVSDKFEVRDN